MLGGPHVAAPNYACHKRFERPFSRSFPLQRERERESLRCRHEHLGKSSRCCLRGDRSLSQSYMATCSRDACVLFGRFYLATMHGVDSLGSMNSKGSLREPTREAGTFDWILLPFHLNIFEY